MKSQAHGKLTALKELKKSYLQQMFPQEGEKVPRVRFDGFSGDWEERKLGEVAEFSKGNGYSKGDLTSAGTPIILYGRLYTKYETIIDNVDTFVEPKDRSVISDGGEVIVPSSGETAEDISRASVVNKQGIILGGDLNIVKPDATINPTFLAITISNGNQQKELSKRAQGKSVVHISNSDLKDVALQLPTLPEQTAIGGFFRALDELIALEQRKLDALKELKKACLQQMFPQAGEKVPRIRFDGFSGDWEERKLGEVVERITTGKLDANAMVESGTYDFYTSGVRKYKIDKFAFEGPAITIAGNGATVGYMHLADGKFNAYQRTYVLSGFKVDRQFVFSEISNNLPRKIAEEARTGNIPYIVMDMLTALKIIVPTLSEQTAIGGFFRALDELIALQQ